MYMMNVHGGIQLAAPAESVVKRGGDASRLVSVFQPLDLSNANSSNRESFKRALYATFRGEAEGVLTPYLFYDPPEPDKSNDVWGAQETNIPLGAKAWDNHVSENVDASKPADDSSYDFTRSDVVVLKHALDNGLVARLPKNIAFYSYGPGDPLAVRAKDCVLIQSILNDSGHFIRNYSAVDINDRYAHEAATEMHKRFNIHSQAIQGDFMEGDLGLGPKNGTSVIAVFGGSFANAPIIGGRATSKDKAVEYLSKLTLQHGMGTQIIMTVDMENDEHTLLSQYAKTKSFEAFVLSSFPRAVNEGIIKKPYDVFDHWRMVTEYDRPTKAIKLIAECKKDHVISLEDGDAQFVEGYRMTNIIANKWDKTDLRKILKSAGFSDIRIYDTKGSSKKLVTARALNEPEMSF